MSLSPISLCHSMLEKWSEEKKKMMRKREKCVDAGEERGEIRKNLCGGWEEDKKKPKSILRAML